MIAERLLRRFGSIAAITDAPEIELRQAALYGERWLDSFLAVRNLIQLGMKEEVVQTRLDPADRRLHRYLKTVMGPLKRERMLAILGDAAGFVIGEEIVGEGTSDHIEISQRDIFAIALKLEARRLILVHNHPSGSAEPSEDDIRANRAIADQATRLGIVLVDHLVVSRRKVVSMRERGYL